MGHFFTSRRHTSRQKAWWSLLLAVFILGISIVQFAGLPGTHPREDTGILLSHTETRSGKSTHVESAVQYDGVIYYSGNMKYGSAIGLGQPRDEIALSLFPDGSIEISEAIHQKKILVVWMFITTFAVAGISAYHFRKHKNTLGNKGSFPNA